MPKSNEKGKSTAAYFLRIAGVLTLICSVVALMLAAVNAVTKNKISDNLNKEKLEAVSRIFDGVEGVVPAEGSDHEILLVSSGDTALGYCVSVKPQGYGGEIEMLVGISPDKTIKGVEIISMSETPGVGSRVKSDENFLPQFAGKTGPFEPGNGADAISGASISSKAVMAGINEAIGAEFDLFSAASANGLTVDGGDEGDDTSSDAESAETSIVETAETAAPVTAQPEQTEPDTYIDPAYVGGNGDAYAYPADNY